MKKVLAMIILALFAVNTSQVAFADDMDSPAPTHKTHKKKSKKKSHKKAGKKGKKSKHKSSHKGSHKGNHKSKKKGHKKAKQAAPPESSDAAMAVPSTQTPSQ